MGRICRRRRRIERRIYKIPPQKKGPKKDKSPERVLSPYEILRQTKIKRNLEKIKELELYSIVQGKITLYNFKLVKIYYSVNLSLLHFFVL